MVHKIELGKKATIVNDVLKNMKSAVVAFSGGVDSTLMLKFALDILGQNRVKAVYFSSCLQSRLHEQHIVNFTKSQFGTDSFLEIIQCFPLEDVSFTQNDQERCYICKKNLYTNLIRQFRSFTTHFLDGTNYSDLFDDRPGYRAIKELNIVTPLADAKLYKEEIRQLARENNLQNWDLSSNSCLATRISQDEIITLDALEVIDKAEEFILAQQIFGVRVKKKNKTATVTVPANVYNEKLTKEVRNKISNHLKMLGFDAVLFKQNK